jgi:hypothetical protein
MKRWIAVGVMFLVGLWVCASRFSPGATENARDAADGGKAQLLAAFPANVSIDLIDRAGSARSLQRVRIMDLTQVGGVSFLVIQTFEGMTSYVNMGEILRITAVRDIAGRRGATPATMATRPYQVEQ